MEVRVLSPVPRMTIILKALLVAVSIASVASCATSPPVLEPVAWCDGYETRIDSAISSVPVGSDPHAFRAAIVAALPPPEAAALEKARQRVRAARATPSPMPLDRFAWGEIVEAFDGGVATCAEDARHLQKYILADRIRMQVLQANGDPERFFASELRPDPADGDPLVAVLLSLVSD